jgi:oligoendopeptidase F
MPQASPNNNGSFLPSDFEVTEWDTLKPYFQELSDRTIESVEALEQWLKDRNELEALLSEEFARRYIAITVDTTDEKAGQQYQQIVQEIAPKVSPAEDKLNRKLVNSELKQALDKQVYGNFIRGVENEVALFREENIPLDTQIQLQQKKYGELFAQMTIEHDGQTLTLQQARVLLEETDRSVRESVFHKINQRVLDDKEALEQLFDGLRDLRHQKSLNAGFSNYRDFKFKALGRFDYTPEDCIAFHESIETEMASVIDKMYQLRKEKLGLDPLRPWDLSVDWSGKPPLRPFQTTKELIEKTSLCLEKVHPTFGNYLRKMDTLGHLDLDTRTGKSPGGYNISLHKTGVPFIFMNASNSLADMRTLLHESGHAVHSFLMDHQPIVANKQPPPEVAELASMTMELLTMDYWDLFIQDADDLRRARINQLENVLITLPWTATVDQFQHWLYTHPQHSHEERRDAWNSIRSKFTSSLINRNGLDHFYDYAWHKQLHIFEVPFYYIEYGMAQLGALAIWKRYRQDKESAVADFMKALELGYTRPIGEIYEAAGIRFDFSAENVRELVNFVERELEELIG